MPTILVVGPPCAGKTTYVTQHAAPTDTVIDYDAIAVRLGSPSHWQHPEPYKSQAQAEVDHLIEALIESPPDHTTWLIRSLPDQVKRRTLAEQLNAQVVVLDPGRSTCEQRAESRPSGTKKAIGLWYWRNRVTG